MSSLDDPAPGRTLRQSGLRESNLSTVLRAALSATDPLSRAGLATAIATTRSTAGRLVDELVAAGLLTESSAGHPVRPGRPGALLAAGPRFCALGLQVNVGFLAARVVDLAGSVVTERVVDGDFRDSDADTVLARLVEVAGATCAAVPDTKVLTGVGLAVPGIVSVDDRRLLYAPNLGWADVDLGALSGRILPGHQLRVGNEADMSAATVAAPAPGRPGPLRDFLYLSGEVGIGGAIVRGGRVESGSHGWGGEIGHVCVDLDGPQCRCGSTGCLELYAGRLALQEAAGRSDDAFHIAARALGVALSSVINIVDVPAIVLGGHLGAVGSRLFPGIEAQLRRRVLAAPWFVQTLHQGPVDSTVGASGAALGQLEDVIDHPARWLDPGPR